jgi:competence protein ComEA
MFKRHAWRYSLHAEKASNHSKEATRMFKQWLGGILISMFFAVQALAAVDLNKAGQAELESVKGIGPKKAKAIIEHRDKNGPFKSVDDLSKVKGFGKASIAKVRGELSVAEVVATEAKN